MGRYFGTDGIRGRFGDDLINPVFAYRLGAAIGRYLAESKDGLMVNAVVGRDTRGSGPDLVEAVTRGLNATGVHVHDAGRADACGRACLAAAECGHRYRDHSLLTTRPPIMG